MTQTMDVDPPSIADASKTSAGTPHERRQARSFTITVRFPYASDPLRLIVRVAKERGVRPRTYIRERAIQCALAELAGKKHVDLGSLER